MERNDCIIKKEVHKTVFYILLIVAMLVGMIFSTGIACWYKFPINRIAKLGNFAILGTIQAVCSVQYEKKKKVVHYICTIILSCLATGIMLQGNQEKEILVVIGKNCCYIVTAILISQLISAKTILTFAMLFRKGIVGTISAGVLGACVALPVFCGEIYSIKLIGVVSYMILMTWEWSVWNISQQGQKYNIDNIMLWSMFLIEFGNCYLMSQVVII